MGEPVKRVGLKTDPAKAIAWARRGKPLQRVFMRPRSKRKTEQIARELEIRNAYKAAHPICEMWPTWIAGFAKRPDCLYSATDLHEPWTRAQGGPTDDPRNMRHLCRNCHSWLDTVDGRRWGIVYGFRVAKGQGAAWLAAGGTEQFDHA